ncbi:hypothetical protein STRIP9103_09129 [Streptomyces ipomoeae 91-03]|uniref:Uncharacterized protein n=1 Tax=Streptomyces ipomoeae 91-03 TaxID=698759 RepID=L1KJZ1_9ACTN|nr:hypothetical protein STRIP9103_09129 [Streptomyces ipomoeae 91-03]
MLGFGTLTLALGVTAVVLLWIGHGVIGALQLTLCVFLTGPHTEPFPPSV